MASTEALIIFAFEKRKSSREEALRCFFPELGSEMVADRQRCFYCGEELIFAASILLGLKGIPLSHSR